MTIRLMLRRFMNVSMNLHLNVTWYIITITLGAPDASLIFIFTRTVSQDIFDGHVLFQRDVADCGKWEYSDQQAAEGIYQRNGDSVHQDRIVESVVTCKAYHRSEGDTHRIEDLRRSVYPDLDTINDDTIHLNEPS